MRSVMATKPLQKAFFFRGELCQQRSSFIPTMISQNPDSNTYIFRLFLLLCLSTLLSFLKWLLQICILVISLCPHNPTVGQRSLGYLGLSNFSSALSRIYKIMTLSHSFPVSNNLFIACVAKQMGKKKNQGPYICTDKCEHLSQHTLRDL